MNQSKELKYYELVIKPCSRVYGSSPCTAAIGTTGDEECHNSPRSCQDPANYEAGAEQVLRWAKPTGDLPIEIDAIPCVTSASRRPMMIAPGEGLGVRESVTVSMHNFKHNDVGLDPYYDQRGYNPFEKGTYWGKFFARWGGLEGAEFRTVDGYLGQDIDDMERRYYQVDSVSGPDANGNVSFMAKDIMKFLDADKAKWPLPSQGVLSADILSNTNSFTLTPSGVGALYGASGLGSLGDEVVSWTRSGDVITLTDRGLRGTEADDHDEGTTFQEAAVYTSLNPAEIVRDILQDATDVPAEYIDFTTWETEVDTFLGRFYSAEIMQTESVKDLIGDLVAEAGLTIYADTANKKIVLKVLRNEVSVTQINDDNMLAGTISKSNQTDKRISDAWVYYGKLNPLEKKTEKKNYAAIYAQLAADPVQALENAPSSIREIFSTWIPVNNPQSSISLSDSLISRYGETPKKISFKVFNNVPLKLGSFFSLQSRVFESTTGDLLAPFKCQVLSIDNDKGVLSVISETTDLISVGVDPQTRIITIDTDILNVNLRTLHDELYGVPDNSDTIKLILSNGARIGSDHGLSNSGSLDIGTWPENVTIEISGTGRIQGQGGEPISGQTGGTGGTAIYTRYDITILGNGLEIWGGGGAGGGSIGGASGTNTYSGGGGAGFVPAGNATTESGGTPQSSVSSGGDGGDPGESGDVGVDDSDPDSSADIDGGDAGPAIDGGSFVTITGTPDIKGPQVN